MTEESFKRKLAAILSADVKGYSILMAEDESHTIETVKTYKQIISDLISAHSGRVVDSPGDNILAEFRSAVDAVDCAVKIQRKLKDENTKFIEEKKVKFRIGVNIGDVVQDGDRIYGNGVNVAARIEGLADPGGVCISHNTYEHIKNKLRLGYENLGDHEVKNIKDPVRVYKILLDSECSGKLTVKKEKSSKLKWILVAAAISIVITIGILGEFYWKYFYLPTPVDIDPENKMTFDLPKGPSIAVLPFDNMTGDPEEEYFCDGFTEHVISSLSHVPELFVIARNSTFAYKGQPKKVQQIGRDLGADYVLEGSIQKSTDRIRVTVQLINANSGYHKWSQTYDREIKDIFDLQDEIALNIINEVGIIIVLGRQGIERSEGIYDLRLGLQVLKLRGLLIKGEKESNKLAQKELIGLIDLYPNKAGLYAFLGYTYILELWYGTCDKPIACIGKATEAARKALSLDEEISDAHALSGLIFLMKKEHDKAIAGVKHALKLNPNNSDAYLFFGYILYLSNRPLEAIEFCNKAIRLNPIPPAFYFCVLGHAYRFAELYEDAIRSYNKSLEIRPYIFSYIGLAASYSLLGREKEAYEAGLEVRKISPEFSLAEFDKISPQKNKSKQQIFINALRKAGLPE